MIEFAFEFDSALQASSGVAEALHAAGADVCVPMPDDAMRRGAEVADDVAD